MSLQAIVDELASLSAPLVFNPYRDTCEVHDAPTAAHTRRANLLSFLQAVQRLGSDTVWMGRDLGYNGGRRTGLAFTGETDFALLMRLYPGASVERATKTSPVSERTSTVIWQAIAAVPQPPMLWNVFQQHPHLPGNPFSNRKFLARERELVDGLNYELIQALGLRRMVGVGADAAHYAQSICAQRMGLQCHALRHPSYGGINEFREGVAKLYGLQVGEVGLHSMQRSLL